MKEFIMPAGTYFVGDPCYVISDKRWDKYLDLIYDGDMEKIKEFSIGNGKKKGFVWAHTTAWGDGSYYDNLRNEYGVDSGMIGATPIDIVSKKYIKEAKNRKDLGHFFTFDKPFNVTYEDGRFYIGHIYIDTKEDLDDDY